MKPKTSFKISQDYEIIQPLKGKVYPIFIQEWIFIRKKVTDIKFNINFYHTFGSISIGASLSFLATNLSAEFKSSDTEVLCWALFAVTFICGVLSFIFGESKRKEFNTKPIEIIHQMDLIETRFEKQ